MSTQHTDKYATRPTVAKPGTIVSTLIDTSGIEPIAQTVTFTRSSLPPFFTTRVTYGTPDEAEFNHHLAVAMARTVGHALFHHGSGVGWIA